MVEILHIFWLDFKHFQNKTGPFDKQTRWLKSAALTSSNHIWHELYYLAYTGVLGFVACRTTSKTLGIGACERIWGDVNHIKTGKISHMGCCILPPRLTRQV